LFTARSGERVESRPAIIRRSAPLGIDPAFVFQTLEGGIKCPVIDQQNILRLFVDRPGDPLAVLWTKEQRAEDQ